MKKIFSFLIILLVVLSIGVPEFAGGNHYLPNTVEAASPKLNKRQTYLKVGTTAKLSVKNTDKKVKWTSSNNEIATVRKGVVTAKKEGTATITATVANQNYTCLVEVAPITLNYESTDLSKGEILELKLAGINGRSVKWRSTNKKIATVDKNGKIKGRKGGEVKIEATYQNKTYTCNVTVFGKEILVYSNDDIEVYYYSSNISMIDKTLYDKSDAPDEEFTNVGVTFRVKNKMDSGIDCYIDCPELNGICVQNGYGFAIIPPNSIKTIQSSGYIDPFYYHADKFKLKKISGDVIYRTRGYRGEEYFSKNLK